MPLIKRYDFEEEYNAGLGIVERQNGKWVKFDDVAEFLPPQQINNCPPVIAQTQCPKILAAIHVKISQIGKKINGKNYITLCLTEQHARRRKKMQEESMLQTELREEFAAVINRHSGENEANIPDFILADYLVRCFNVFNYATQSRDKWYGVHLEPCASRFIQDEESPQQTTNRYATAMEVKEEYLKIATPEQMGRGFMAWCEERLNSVKLNCAQQPQERNAAISPRCHK